MQYQTPFISTSVVLVFLKLETHFCSQMVNAMWICSYSIHLLRTENNWYFPPIHIFVIYWHKWIKDLSFNNHCTLHCVTSRLGFPFLFYYKFAGVKILPICENIMKAESILLISATHEEISTSQLSDDDFTEVSNQVAA